MRNDNNASWFARENRNKYKRNQIRDKAAANRRIANSIKVESGCVDCGYNANYLALQFDHKEGSDKHYEVSQIVKRSPRRMLAEIAKCEVRCANCHAIKTTGTKQHLSRRLKVVDKPPQGRLF